MSKAEDALKYFHEITGMPSGLPDTGFVGGFATNFGRDFSTEEPSATQLKTGTNPPQKGGSRLNKKKKKSKADELEDILKSFGFSLG